MNGNFFYEVNCLINHLQVHQGRPRKSKNIAKPGHECSSDF